MRVRQNKTPFGANRYLHYSKNVWVVVKVQVVAEPQEKVTRARKHGLAMAKLSLDSRVVRLKSQSCSRRRDS